MTSNPDKKLIIILRDDVTIYIRHDGSFNDVYCDWRPKHRDRYGNWCLTKEYKPPYYPTNAWMSNYRIPIEWIDHTGEKGKGINLYDDLPYMTGKVNTALLNQT